MDCVRGLGAAAEINIFDANGPPWCVVFALDHETEFDETGAIGSQDVDLAAIQSDIAVNAISEQGQDLHDVDFELGALLCRAPVVGLVGCADGEPWERRIPAGVSLPSRRGASASHSGYLAGDRYSGGSLERIFGITLPLSGRATALGSPYRERRPLERLVRRADFAARTKPFRASLTASDVGKAAAFSGLRTTTFEPAARRAAYFPRMKPAGKSERL